MVNVGKIDVMSVGVPGLALANLWPVVRGRSLPLLFDNILLRVFHVYRHGGAKHPSR